MGASEEVLGVGAGARCSQKQQETSKESHSRFVHNYLSRPFDTSSRNITIGLLSSFKFNKLALGAFPVAVEDVNSDPNLLVGRRLVYQVADVGHSGSEALASLSIRRMTMMRDAGLLAFIGPDDNCENEALVAAAWNLPMITYKCGDHNVGNKTKYYTMARTTPPATKIVKALVSLMLEYRWRHFVLLTEAASTFEQISDAVQSFAAHHKMRLADQFTVPYDYTTRRYPDMQKLVQLSLQKTRVYVVVASYEVQWDLVLALREAAGPLLSDYVVLTIDDEKYAETDSSQNMRIPGKQAMDMSEALTERIYHGFRAVLKITPTHPTDSKYRKFERKVLYRLKQHPFCLPYNPKVFKYIQVPIFAAHLYDAVMMYAQVLNETLADPLADPANGTHILSLIRNRSFQSIQGPKVHMDENGDAEGTYSLLRVVRRGGHHATPLGWRQVGQFQFHDMSPATHPKDNLPTLKLQSPIPWLGGRPPRDEPPCGFQQEKCHYDWYPLVIGLVVSLVIVVAALFLIQVTRQSVRRGSSGAGGTVEVSCEVPRVAYCAMGVYRGNVVALKYVKRRSVDLTRAIRKELKQMRETRHENLTVFVGACVEAGGVVILTPYCARGSLQDVLQNDDLPLDDLFVASLIADLIKAMTFLHDSEIVSHGRLRSSNCLVDSRWVLQVSDYGLHEFQATAEQEVDPKKRLWTAPELLQDPTAHPRGSQKGDVFSFAIILYEVVGRRGPWGPLLQKMGAQEILRQACAEGLRPPLEGVRAAEYVTACLKDCWSPTPEDRPDFKGVRLKLKEMQAGLKLNIVDNMLAMLEKYAYNLEGKVQERTKQLLEEKKKTEILLLRMLPKSVAESLKRGEQVPPESYDNVTIYFSDIVGFTLLSAQSTPLQVETIGDAYMVVSGLPISNGDRHAAEIASMALKLLSAVKVFRIRHRPGDTLKLRIGIHSATAKVRNITLREKASDAIIGEG
ncbi:hypothetical protein O3P69_015888 [Scylla paramamosain]|uniref:guanylate cyclase n=1 Tax=Scylla paramamosain TaxID=85552 RepID=A0AAW0T909_SCYPA